GPGALGLEGGLRFGPDHGRNVEKSRKIVHSSSESSGKSPSPSGSLSRASSSKSSSSPSSSKLAMLCSSLELILTRYLVSWVDTSTASMSSPLRFLKLMTSLSPYPSGYLSTKSLSTSGVNFL